MHQTAIKTKTRKENGEKRERYSEMKTFIISMSLFAVTAAYIALRLPIEKTETEKPTVTENDKREKGGTIRVRILSQVEKASAED